MRGALLLRRAARTRDEGEKKAGEECHARHHRGLLESVAVGGRDLPQAGDFNRATQAPRQTGSAFKPFIYAVAMDLGYSPMDYVYDSPWSINVPGSGVYAPKNYDGKFKGMITLTQALAESRNIYNKGNQFILYEA